MSYELLKQIHIQNSKATTVASNVNNSSSIGSSNNNNNNSMMVNNNPILPISNQTNTNASTLLAGSLLAKAADQVERKVITHNDFYDRYNNRRPRTWHESFEELKAYKEMYGTLTFNRKQQKYRNLCTWSSYQRKYQANLSHEKRVLLTSLGFDFETQDQKAERAWNAQFQRIKSLQKEYLQERRLAAYDEDKDMMMMDKETIFTETIKDKCSNDKSLSRWICNQRRFLQQGRLSDHRFALLDSIGFPFNINNRTSNSATNNNNNNNNNDNSSEHANVTPPKIMTKKNEAWFLRYEKLKAFRQREGHCLVPQSNDDIGTWVMNQRSLNRKNRLKENRKKLLDELGFVWDVEDFLASEEGKWETNFYRVARICEGNFEVKEYELKTFLEKNIDQGRRGQLENDRARRLIGLGFTWVEEDDAWNANFARFCLAYDMKGLRAVAADSWLEAWLRMQTNMDATNTLAPDRKAKLKGVLGGSLTDVIHLLANRARTNQQGIQSSTAPPNGHAERAAAIHAEKMASKTASVTGAAVATPSAKAYSVTGGDQKVPSVVTSEPHPPKEQSVAAEAVKSAAQVRAREGIFPGNAPADTVTSTNNYSPGASPAAAATTTAEKRPAVNAEPVMIQDSPPRKKARVEEKEVDESEDEEDDYMMI